MAETENTPATEETTTEATAEQPTEAAAPEAEEEISYHAVEKEGNVTAIWEMQGRKHLRPCISPSPITIPIISDNSLF